MTCRCIILWVVLLLPAISGAQNDKMYDPELNQFVQKRDDATVGRVLRYHPDGEDFVIVNGNKKFNRALYGTNTAFRIETGDVPEFAFYLPRMGGNLSFRLSAEGKSKSLNQAAYIESRYRAGSRIYLIRDKLLGNGQLKITVLAMADAEGMIIRAEAYKIPEGVMLEWIFGGCADKRFSREGDLGVDPPDSFELKQEYCKGNDFSINENAFQVVFGAKKDRKLTGVFPENSILKIDEKPVLSGKMSLPASGKFFMAIQIPQQQQFLTYNRLPDLFNAAELTRQKIASSLKINTPDPYFNTLGSTISMAADGIWDGKVWQHGAIGWRMPLNGWRAGYTGDVMGWHDRARIHFDAYAASQVVDVEPVMPHPNQDSSLNLARAVKKWGTQMYSNGYICRNPENNNQMHHYDMNLAYIDELLWHFNWTGDWDYVKKMWPVLKSHLAWEKRNFDPDDDGLYNAYCCIWASDALYYNSGGVTHSSAYNYRANKMAAMLAEKIGEDPLPYQREARKILQAINQKLWISSKGHWAEFVDFMGDKMLHESAAIWTIYHAIDSDIQDPLQAYQATRYVDTQIPHIAVNADGLPQNQYQVISTSNWMPYSWSINNVAVAETNHMALAYWQSGRYEEAFNLLKSSLLDNMYVGSSPGNVGQISFYDAARGECYRDFGDPIGITTRAIVQGLFGILPDALHGKLIIRPGFPTFWNHASIENATLAFSFQRKGNKSYYSINQHFKSLLSTELIVPVNHVKIRSVKVNGVTTSWKLYPSANGKVMISIITSPSKNTKIEIIEEGQKLSNKIPEFKLMQGENWSYQLQAEIAELIDPQHVLTGFHVTANEISGKIAAEAGNHTLFVQLKKGELKWIQPIHIQVAEHEKPALLPFMQVDSQACEVINFDHLLNDSVSNIFKHKYQSPRSPYTTLQIPVQGIGEWCHPALTAEIDDSGLRHAALNNQIHTNTGVPFRTPQKGNNIAFTSRWNNFPQKITVPLSGKAGHAYLMLAGTTNHMQYKVDNGYVIASYTDGSSDTLKLINPENWCPIEQDFYVDNKAFKLETSRPYRIHLKTALISNELEKDLGIKGIYGRKIEGGAGVMLDMKLNPDKNLSQISVETKANEVIIGLMAITLQR